MTRTSFASLALATIASLALVAPAARSGQTVDADGPAIAVDVAPSLEQIRTRGEVRHVRLGERTGRVAAVYGDLGTLSAVDASGSEDALAFVGEVAPLVGSSDPAAELVADRRVRSPLGTHARLRQRVGEYKVFGASVDVHATADGRVYGVTTTFATDLDPALAFAHPTVDASAAFDAAVASLGVPADRVRTGAGAAPELGVAPEGRGRLAWRVVVPLREPYEQWRLVVDAGTGQVVGEPEPMVARAGRARLFVPNAVVTSGNVSLPDGSNGPVAEASYTDVDLLGLDASGFVAGPYCTTDRTDNRVRATNGDFTALRRSDRGFNEVEAYWAIDSAQRYIQDTLGIDNAANYQIRVDAYAFSDDNSNYTLSGDGTGVLNFGEGGVDDAQDAEIVWHEYGHAILDNQAGLRLSGESGAMHEGWGDYVAATMSTRFPGDARFHPTVGEWDAVSYNPGNPAFLRRVDTSKQYPRDLRNLVHTDGEIWSSCLWEIHEALGRDAANRIIFNANFLLPTDATFLDGGAAVLESDRLLNGGANAAVIREAFANHGILIESTAPAVTSVRVKGRKLVVDGADFETNAAIVEVDGEPFGSLKYPKEYRRNGVSQRITSKDTRVRSLEAGRTYQVTVLNQASGVRSAPFQFTP